MENHTGMLSPTLQKIKNALPKLTPAAKKVAEFVLEHPDKVVQSTITDLAKLSQVGSESSVVRFYRSLGFEGFHEFKVTLAGEISGHAISHTYENITIDDTIDEVKRKIFSSSIRAFQDTLKSLSDSSLEKAVQVLRESRRIICIGYGTSASIAHHAAFKFSFLGKDSFFSTDSHANAVILSKLTSHDCVLAISHSGESKDVVIPLQKAEGNPFIISMTGYKNSSLAKISDLHLITNLEETAMRTDVMIARYLQMALVDILLTAMAIEEGEGSLQQLSDSRRALTYLKY